MITRPAGAANAPWLLSSVRSEDWRTDAACRTANPALFDERLDGEAPDEQTARHKQAIAVCKTCTVAEQCDASFVRGVDEGVRNGRRLPPILEVRKGPAEIVHGTERGEKQHRRRNDPPCQPCLDAANRAKKDREARTAAKQPPRVAECGTYSGYKKHRRKGEEQCDPCREARNSYEREQRAAKLAKRRAA